MGDDRLPGRGRPNDGQRWVCPRRCDEDGFGAVAPYCEAHGVLMVTEAEKAKLIKPPA